ncbi:MAG: hypothetical protein WBX04_12165, partial [Candidatus Sulfotelmatobacter sp.]
EPSADWSSPRFTFQSPLSQLVIWCRIKDENLRDPGISRKGTPDEIPQQSNIEERCISRTKATVVQSIKTGALPHYGVRTR